MNHVGTRSGSWLSLNQVMFRCPFFLSILLFNIMLYSDGEIHLDTPFSQLLGKPPIFVAGMTPSTVKAGFVSAVLDAGYQWFHPQLLVTASSFLSSVPTPKTSFLLLELYQQFT